MYTTDSIRAPIARALLLFAFTLPANCLSQIEYYTPPRSTERGKHFRVQYIGGLINDHLIDDRWNRIRGRLGSRAYPLFTRFTRRPNHNAVTPPRWRHPFAPDLSNVGPKTEGQLVSYHWANTAKSEDIALTIKTRMGKTELCKPVSWYSSFAVIIDDFEGRRIASLGAGDKLIQSLLDHIV